MSCELDSFSTYSLYEDYENTKEEAVIHLEQTSAGKVGYDTLREWLLTFLTLLDVFAVTV